MSPEVSTEGMLIALVTAARPARDQSRPTARTDRREPAARTRPRSRLKAAAGRSGRLWERAPCSREPLTDRHHSRSVSTIEERLRTVFSLELVRGMFPELLALPFGEASVIFEKGFVLRDGRTT